MVAHSVVAVIYPALLTDPIKGVDWLLLAGLRLVHNPTWLPQSTRLMADAG